MQKYKKLLRKKYSSVREIFRLLQFLIVFIQIACLMYKFKFVWILVWSYLHNFQLFFFIPKEFRNYDLLVFKLKFIENENSD